MTILDPNLINFLVFLTNESALIKVTFNRRITQSVINAYHSSPHHCCLHSHPHGHI